MAIEYSHVIHFLVTVQPQCYVHNYHSIVEYGEDGAASRGVAEIPRIGFLERSRTLTHPMLLKLRICASGSDE